MLPAAQPGVWSGIKSQSRSLSAMEAGVMKKVLVIVSVLVAALVVGACGSGGSTSSVGPSNTRDSTGGSNGSVMPVKGQPATNTGGGGSVTYTPDQVPQVEGPKVIRQAQLSVTVKAGAFDSTLADVRSLVQLQGGFIAGTDAQSNPAFNDQIRTGVITFMVPAEKFDNTIDQLAKLGKVQNEHITGQDVSAQYVDLQARLANAEAQRNAMIALLKRAQSISDIIAVQNQLGQITQTIEQLKGQINYFDHNTAYSSVSVTITEAGVAPSTQPVDNWGFSTALSDAAHNFVATVNYVVTGLGAIGPFVILLGLGYWIWRRRGGRLPLRQA